MYPNTAIRVAGIIHCLVRDNGYTYDDAPRQAYRDGKLSDSERDMIRQAYDNIGK